MGLGDEYALEPVDLGADRWAAYREETGPEELSQMEGDAEAFTGLTEETEDGDITTVEYNGVTVPVAPVGSGKTDYAAHGRGTRATA